MKKLLTTLIVSMFCVAFNSASPAQSTRSQAPVSKASNAKCAIRFHTLSRYKGNRWSTIFSDREVAPALKTLLKSDYGNLKVILDEGKRFLYFSNDQKYIDKLPPAIDEWRNGVEARRSQPTEVPKLPVVFRNK